MSTVDAVAGGKYWHPAAFGMVVFAPWGGGGGGINSLFPTARDVYFSTWKFPEAADRIVLPVRPSIHPFIHSSADIPEILVC